MPIERKDFVKDRYTAITWGINDFIDNKGHYNKNKLAGKFAHEMWMKSRKETQK